MKLLLSDAKIRTATKLAYENAQEYGDDGQPLPEKAVAKAQLKKIFNLDIKTTSELIVKLEARLDELYQKEMAK